jgi:hypothetical protein
MQKKDRTPFLAEFCTLYFLYLLCSQNIKQFFEGCRVKNAVFVYLSLTLFAHHCNMQFAESRVCS